ncbi:MAG: glycosyltransferase [Spirochaetales bacterium]|nr:glycosyltransferase [Spirochaetales bacterium]
MKFAFILRDFPGTSQTFITRQIEALAARGFGPDLFITGTLRESLLGPALMKQCTLHVVQKLPPKTGKLKTIMHTFRILPAKQRGRFLSDLIFGNHVVNSLLIRFLLQYRQVMEYRNIVCHFGNIGVLADSLVKYGILSGDIVCFFHGHDASRIIRQFGASYYKSLFRNAARIFSVNRFFRDRLIGLGCPQHKISVNHMGIQAGRPPDAAGLARDDDSLDMLAVARLVEKKGIDTALQALDRIRNKISVTLTVIGDGPCMADLLALREKLGLEDIVSFRGVLDNSEVIAAMDKANVFILPSRTGTDGDMEGIPVSLMEAMSRGMIVFSTRHSGIPELIEHGVTGFLAAENDPDGLAGVILEAYRNRQNWNTIRAGAAGYVRSEFNLDTEVDNFVAALCAGKTGGDACPD